MTMHPAAWVQITVGILLSIECWAAPALSWGEGEGFRSRSVQPTGAAKVGFTAMEAGATGISFTNLLDGDAFLTNAVAHNGAGLAIGDVDGDGWADIYLCSLQGPNRLYKNLGEWKFQEVALGAAACGEQFSTGATFADVDGDGDLDLLVNGLSAGTRLFVNDGKGGLEERESGLSKTASPTSMALGDFDGDGDLDLYCTHYTDIIYIADPTTRFGVMRRGDKWEVNRVNGLPARLPKFKDRFVALPNGKVRELAEPDAMYRNDGKGGFTPVDLAGGIFLDAKGESVSMLREWGLAVMFRDLNGDLAPDIYVCNDMPSPDRVWMNTGKGTFREIGPFVMRHTSRSSMGIDFGDVNRDGRDDIFVVDMLARERAKRLTQLDREMPDPQLREVVTEEPRFNRNMLFYGREDGTYAEGAFLAGVAASDWSWSPVLLDVDLDGYEDILISNGFSFDVMDQDSSEYVRTGKFTEAQLKRYRQLHPKWPTENVAFRNFGDGTFEPMSDKWQFNKMGISYGMALGDLDNDGDLDVVVNNLNEAASLYRNDATRGRIAVRLKGREGNTKGIGAKIKLIAGEFVQAQEMIAGGRYMSGDDAVRMFAVPDGAAGMRLEVTWRNGERSMIEKVEGNRVYEVEQGRASVREISKEEMKPAPIFAEMELISHTHFEAPHDDWLAQPLLPWRTSRLGPGVSWFDLDGDGWEELIIGTGRGGKLAVFSNGKGTEFSLREEQVPSRESISMAMGWSDGKGGRRLLAAGSNIDAGARAGITRVDMSPALGKAEPGAMAVADVDRDGDLDLFVGGRHLPGRYPQAVSSAIWLNNDGRLEIGKEVNDVFSGVGLVNGATFSDLDGDGYSDLALAIEWGPVKVFRNEGGRFVEVTKEWGFEALKGWWTGISAGDFDGDGRMDLALGNRGGNSTYELYRPGSVRVYYGDWDGDGRLELIESAREGEEWVPVRNRTWQGAGLASVAQQFKTHADYTRATVREILGPNYPKAEWLEVNMLESGVFLNRGGRFEWKAFPTEAQMTATFSVNVGDMDANGTEDLFLSQNLFGSASDISREDSGRGLWLSGNGDGTFTTLEGSVSGIKVYGEQRGAALCDFNHDGRVDLAVSQNNGPTKLFVNQGSKRGVRVVLEGPARNPEGIGAQIRMHYDGRSIGPAREVTAGGGYWSQNAATQVMGWKTRPREIWIRWPGGREELFRLAEEQAEVRVKFQSEEK